MVDMRSKTIQSVSRHLQWLPAHPLIPSRVSDYLNSHPTCSHHKAEGQIIGQIDIEKHRDNDSRNSVMRSCWITSVEPSVEASEIFAALKEIQSYGWLACVVMICLKHVVFLAMVIAADSNLCWGYLRLWGRIDCWWKLRRGMPNCSAVWAAQACGSIFWIVRQVVCWIIHRWISCYNWDFCDYNTVCFLVIILDCVLN